MISQEQLQDYINYQLNKTKGEYIWKCGKVWYKVHTIAFSAISTNEYHGIIELMYYENPKAKSALEWSWKDGKYSIERLF